MILNCEFDENQPRSYKCFVTSTVVTKPAVKIRTIRGKHQEDKTNRDVTEIEFSNTMIKYIPQGLDQHFKSLRSLIIESCGLKVITRDDLVGLENLEKLLVWSNELKSLPSDLFTKMYRLKEISFYDNKIETLSSTLLKPIINNDLRSINFQKNSRIDAFYKPGIQGSVGSVEELMMIMEKCNMESFAPSSSDFTIFVQEVSSTKEYRVHKHVLAKQSEVFASIFKSNSALHKAGKMRIKEFSSTTVSGFLRFIYTGVLPTEINALELFTMASKYKTESLKVLAEEMVMRIIDQENALQIFNIAHTFKAYDLKRAAFGSIKKMFPENTLDETAMNKPNELNKLIETKKTCDKVLHEALQSFYTA